MNASARTWDRGSSLPETAIVMAVLLTLMFGIIDFGRAIYTYGFVADLAREGARWSIVRGSTSCLNSSSQLSNCGYGTNYPASNPLQTYVQSLSEGATVSSSITATPSWPSCTSTSPGGAKDAPGCTVNVTVSYPFQFLMPLWSHATITMSSTSKMVISQ